MALPVVESSSSGQAESSSVTITAPTGITTGDLLIGSYTAFRFAGAITHTTPSGWTNIQSGLGASSKVGTNTFYKVAVLADESATDYTFTATSADQISGAIQRISGAASGNEITVSEVDVITSGAGTTVSHTAASTPPTGESLMIICTGGGDETIAAVVTHSTYTSTPTVTWTERADLGYRNASSDGSSHAVATGPYTGTTQFTAYGFSTSEALADNGLISVLIIVSAPEDATGTNTLLSVSPTLFSQSGIGGTTGTNALLEVSPTHLTQSGTGDTPSVWTNINKA